MLELPRAPHRFDQGCASLRDVSVSRGTRWFQRNGAPRQETRWLGVKGYVDAATLARGAEEVATKAAEAALRGSPDRADLNRVEVTLFSGYNIGILTSVRTSWWLFDNQGNSHGHQTSSYLGMGQSLPR